MVFSNSRDEALWGGLLLQSRDSLCLLIGSCAYSVSEVSQQPWLPFPRDFNTRPGSAREFPFFFGALGLDLTNTTS